MIAYTTLTLSIWAVLIVSEFIAKKRPDTKYSKFWRKHIITDRDLGQDK
jgi:hypothetical protein